MKKEVLSIEVHITGAEEVKGTTGEAYMVFFDAVCDCDFFHGKTVHEGVDTQQQTYPKLRNLSARYLLEGKDQEGQDCRLFIENNGVVQENGEVVTHPRILTNSQALSFLETAALSGWIEGIEGGVKIHIDSDVA